MTPSIKMAPTSAKNSPGNSSVPNMKSRRTALKSGSTVKSKARTVASVVLEGSIKPAFAAASRIPSSPASPRRLADPEKDSEVLLVGGEPTPDVSNTPLGIENFFPVEPDGSKFRSLKNDAEPWNSSAPAVAENGPSGELAGPSSDSPALSMLP